MQWSRSSGCSFVRPFSL